MEQRDLERQTGLLGEHLRIVFGMRARPVECAGFALQIIGQDRFLRRCRARVRRIEAIAAEIVRAVGDDARPFGECGPAIRRPDRPGIDRARIERRLGIARREEDQADVGGLETLRIERTQQKVVADRAARRRDPLAVQTACIDDPRPRRHQDREAFPRSRRRGLHCHRLDRTAALVGELERRIADHADVDRTRADRLQQRLRGGEFGPFDAVGRTLERARGEHQRLGAAALAADVQHVAAHPAAAQPRIQACREYDGQQQRPPALQAFRRGRRRGHPLVIRPVRHQPTARFGSRSRSASRAAIRSWTTGSRSRP